MRRTTRLLRFVVIALGVVGFQAAIGFAAAERLPLAYGAVAMTIAAVIGLSAPALLAVAVWPATFIAHRVGPAAFDLSATDALLLAAGLIALPLVSWRSPGARKLMMGIVVYQAMVLTSVLANPSARAGLEWLHRAHLVIGGAAVGMLIAQRGKVRVAMRLFIATAVVFSVSAIYLALAHDFAPAYPLGIHKNAAGSLITLALVIVIAASKAHGLSKAVRNTAVVLLFAGLLATQARGGAAIALVVMVALMAFSSHRSAGLRTLAGITALSVIGLLAATYVTRDARNADSQFTSINSRRLTYDYSIDLWKTKPLTGVGLRFWSDPNVKLEGRQSFGEPHNFAVSALGETGVIGLLALVILLWQMFGAVRLAGGEVGRVTRVAFFGLLAESLFGILWVAGTFTARMLLVGMAIGAVVASGDGNRTKDDDGVLDLRDRVLLS